MSSPYQDEIDAMTWSFSRINSYLQCPYGWKLHYLDHQNQAGSGFADWGSLCHSILDDYAKGNLADFELLDAYESRYPEYMRNEYPPSRGGSLAERYYERGREFFASFAGFQEYWEVIGSEIKVTFQIDGKNFLGYIDLLVRDRRDGRLIVIDHKSKGGFKNKEELSRYAMQLYLYAYWVFLHYREYPKELIFNMFRIGETTVVPFDIMEMERAVSWFRDTIQTIYEDVDFWDKIAMEYEASGKFLSEFKHNDFFCNYLCGSREGCPRSTFKQ